MVLSDTRINFIGQVCWYIPKKIKPQSFYSTFCFIQKHGFADTHCQGQCSCDLFSNSAQRECGFGPWAGEGSGWRPGVLSASCPETQYWSVSTCDTTRPHTAPRCRIWTLDRWVAANLQRLSKMIFFTCSTGVGSVFSSWSKPQEPQMEEMCFLVFTTSQWPVFFHCSGSPRWLCSLHHGCLFPITAEITTMFMTHRRRSRQINSLHIAAKRLREHRYIIILPTVIPINLL